MSSSMVLRLALRMDSRGLRIGRCFCFFFFGVGAVRVVRARLRTRRDRKCIFAGVDREVILMGLKVEVRCCE